MLSNEQLDVILNGKLTKENLYLLEHHIMYISDLKDEYDDKLPIDVAVNLNADLDRIIKRLQVYLNKGIEK